MPIARFQFEDGRIGRFEVPEGTTPEEAQAMIEEHVFSAPKAEAYQPKSVTDGMSGMEKFKAGVGKAMVDTGRGAGQLLRHLVPDSVGDSIGLPTQADIDEAKRLDAPLMATGAGMAGDIAGNIAMVVAPGSALKYAGTALKSGKLAALGDALITPDTFRKGAAAGATMGAFQPTASDDNAGEQMLIGATGGAIGAALPNVVGRVLSPQTRQGAKTLLDEGVTPTPGQILGGAAQRLEDGATSLPFIGDAIKSAQRRAVDDFNVATYNKALAPIGQTFDKSVKTGHEGVEAVYNRLSDAYDTLLPKLQIRQDPQFNAEINSLRGLAANMPETQARQFENLLDSGVLRRFSQGGGMRGETMKEVDAQLGHEIRLYGKSDNPDHRKLADALRETQSIVRNLVERSNPQYAEQLKGINQGYANLVRIEKAASGLGAHDGVFSPAQLKSAAKASDSSVRKRATAHGKALLQDFAETGQDVLGQKVPDSGTAFRLGNMLPLGASYMMSPDLAISALGAAGAYSRPGQATLAALLTKRPNSLRTLGRYSAAMSPIAGRAGGPTLLDFMQQE